MHPSLPEQSIAVKVICQEDDQSNQRQVPLKKGPCSEQSQWVSHSLIGTYGSACSDALMGAVIIISN